jgi:hypothetical protein
MAALAGAPYPVFDLAEIAQEAAERAGIEFRSGYALRTARRSLELLAIEWANRGLNLWTIEGPVTINLVPGRPTYYLPQDTVDLVEFILRTPSTADPTQYSDIPLDRMTLPEYAAVTNKLAQGRPSIVCMRRAVQPYFHLWMTAPASPAYQLVYWRLKRMQALGAGGTATPDIPWRFIPAMIAGLAFYMALKSTDPKAQPRVQFLKTEYEEQFTLASDEDRDRAAFRYVPGGYEFI